MESDTAIYIAAPNPVFNPASVINFADFDKADSVILYSALTENLVDVISSIKSNADKYLILNHEDESLYSVPANSAFKVYFFNDNFVEDLIKLTDKQEDSYSNNFLILADSIGVSPSTIQHCLNLLKMKDDTIVIGKTYSGLIAFLAFNRIEIPLVKYLFDAKFDYMSFLSHLDTCSAFINVMDKFQRISSVDEFKKLYYELSKKDSLNYCSQEYHEKFTHLFIEHKELL